MAHTTCGSEKPTEESTRERDLGASVGRDSRYGSIYVCPPLSPGPRALLLPPSSSLPPLSLPDPTPSIRPTGRWRGTRGLQGASSAVFWVPDRARVSGEVLPLAPHISHNVRRLV